MLLRPSIDRSTSQHCAPKNRVSESKSVVPEPPGLSKATRSPTNGPSKPPTNQTLTVCGGSPSRTIWHSQEEPLSAPEIPRQLQSAASRRKNGWPGTGSAGSSPKPATGNTTRADRNQTRRWHEPTSASLPVSSSIYQLKTGHGLTGQQLHWTTRHPDASCWWCQYKIQTREPFFQELPEVGMPAKDSLGYRPGGNQVRPGRETVPRTWSCSPMSGPRFSCYNGRRKDGRPTGGRRRRRSLGVGG